VDDLAIPPYRDYSRMGGRWRPDTFWPEWGPELTDAANGSRLLALDAASGKPVWEVGGPASPTGVFTDRCFLGPPLPLDDRLFVLTEKDGELDLVCLSTNGVLLGKQPLGYAPTRLLLDPGRRIQAVRPVYADGVLVCPTAAGLVVGVDVLTLGLAWAYPYRGGPLTEAELSAGGRRKRLVRVRLTAEWQAPVTVAAHGRVLGLRDGTLLWQVAREADDLYVAGVVGGKVLVVGKRACRALDLANGKQLWELETGPPSGVGAAGGNIYYLPLKESEEGKGPAIWAIDVVKGAIGARIPAGKEGPGNLLLGGGGVFSQTATAVTAYPGRDGGK
jgi:outer membrane protein assembly factor BamB